MPKLPISLPALRRLLREIVTSNSVTGDVTTLEDLPVVTRLSAQHDGE